MKYILIILVLLLGLGYCGGEVKKREAGKVLENTNVQQNGTGSNNSQ